MHRKDILTNAITHTCGERDLEYGSPSKNLDDCALLWSAYLKGKYRVVDHGTITAEDVAWFNVLQKMARTFKGVTNADTYEDAAAYAAIAGECTVPTSKPSEGFMAATKCLYCGGGGNNHKSDCPNSSVKSI